MKNGVSLNVYEGEIQAKKREKKEGVQEEEKKEKEKKKRRRYSLDPGWSGLSHSEGDFLKS